MLEKIKFEKFTAFERLEVKFSPGSTFLSAKMAQVKPIF